MQAGISVKMRGLLPTPLGGEFVTVLINEEGGVFTIGEASGEFQKSMAWKSVDGITEGVIAVGTLALPGGLTAPVTISLQSGPRSRDSLSIAYRTADQAIALREMGLYPTIPVLLLFTFNSVWDLDPAAVVQAPATGSLPNKLV